jgi:hypothetical protein
VGDRLVVVLEVVLGPAEVEERLEPRRQLEVREPVDLLQGLRPVGAGGVDVAGDGLAEAQRRGRRGDQRPVAEGVRAPQRLRAHGDRPFVVERVQPVDRELDLQRGGGGRRAVGHLVPGLGQAPVGVLVAPLPVLDRSAQAGQLDAPIARLSGQQLHRLEESVAASLQPADRAQRRGQRHAHGHLALAVAVAEQAQRGPVPAHRGPWRAPRGHPAGLEQDLDRLLVALLGRLLDVVRALRGRGAAGGERLGRTRVGGQAPAAADGLVDRPAHQRMAEGEAARDLRGADEIEREQVVEGVERLRFGELADRRRQVRLEGLAGHRCRVEQGARGGRQRLQLAGDGARHGRRHADRLAVVAARQRARQVARLAGAAELLEVEGVAAAVAVDGRQRRRVDSVEQPGRLRLAQLSELEPAYGLLRRRGGQSL